MTEDERELLLLVGKQFLTPLAILKTGEFNAQQLHDLITRVTTAAAK